MVSEETGELYGVAKSGYVIYGYAYDAAGEDPVGVADANDNYEPQKIYIIWKRQADLTIDLNGGNISASEADVVIEDVFEGTLIKALLDGMIADDESSLYGVERTGYTLTGYAYDDAGTSAVDAESATTHEADTIYLIWEEDGV